MTTGAVFWSCKNVTWRLLIVSTWFLDDSRRMFQIEESLQYAVEVQNLQNKCMWIIADKSSISSEAGL